MLELLTAQEVSIHKASNLLQSFKERPLKISKEIATFHKFQNMETLYQFLIKKALTRTIILKAPPHPPVS